MDALSIGLRRGRAGAGSPRGGGSPRSPRDAGAGGGSPSHTHEGLYLSTLAAQDEQQGSLGPNFRPARSGGSPRAGSPRASSSPQGTTGGLNNDHNLRPSTLSPDHQGTRPDLDQGAVLLGARALSPTNTNQSSQQLEESSSSRSRGAPGSPRSSVVVPKQTLDLGIGQKNRHGSLSGVAKRVTKPTAMLMGALRARPSGAPSRASAATFSPASSSGSANAMVAGGGASFGLQLSGAGAAAGWAGGAAEAEFAANVSASSGGPGGGTLVQQQREHGGMTPGGGRGAAGRVSGGVAALSALTTRKVSGVAGSRGSNAHQLDLVVQAGKGSESSRGSASQPDLAAQSPKEAAPGPGRASPRRVLSPVPMPSVKEEEE